MDAQTAMLAYKCPQCGKTERAELSELRATWRCPHCNSVWFVDGVEP